MAREWFLRVLLNSSSFSAILLSAREHRHRVALKQLGAHDFPLEPSVESTKQIGAQFLV